MRSQIQVGSILIDDLPMIACALAARGVPLSMSRRQSEFLGADPPSRLLLANVVVREEPDDEEDEDDDDGKDGEDEEKEDDEGYSE